MFFRNLAFFRFSPDFGHFFGAATPQDEVAKLFVFGEDLIVRKLRLTEDALESLENTERDSLHAELEARFVILSASVGALFDQLEKSFRLSKVED